MGFYGNITSTNKTQFTFDKIYPNRKTMDLVLGTYVKEGDTSAPGDGVFIGRFVLIDYEDGNLIPSTYYPIFKRTIEETNVFYADSSFETIMTTDLCKKNQVFQYQSGSTFELWRATGESATITIDETEVQYATFVKIEQNEKGDPVEKYLFNYNEDMELYGAGRGYDGTVWQKVFAEGKEKYVMVAELNSVVPTFKITADAPTMMPLEPHFDKQSNNVAYWLHWQPQWGMRVQEAPDSLDKDGNPILDKDGNPIKYSDTEVTWINSVYNPATHNVDSTEEKKAGNIYFNKAGLSKEVRSYHEMEDKVSVTPTGISGYKYQGHNVEPQEAEDIQEISILLPSIGNAISDAWDIVYGVPKSADNKRNLDIDWNSLKGIRMVEDGTSGYKYNSKNANSLAGCINSVHDLMGMIIMEESVADAKDADANSIYYNSTTGKFERKHTTYTYKEVRSISDENTFEEVPGINLLKWEPNKYYYKDSLKNYFIDNSIKPDTSRNYYNPVFEEQGLTPEYIQYKWWYKDGLNYMFGNEEEVKLNTDYYEINKEIGSFIWYKKETYFYKDCLPTGPEDMTKPYLIASHDTLNKNYTYFSIDDKYNIKDLPEQTITYEQAPGEFITVKTKIIPSDANLQKVNLTQFENNKYYKCDYDFTYTEPETGNHTGDFILITVEPKEKLTLCYTLSPEKIYPFYQADTYYYGQENNYLKDRAGEYQEDKHYYKLIAENKIEQKFYIEGEYYEQVNGSYDPSDDTNPDSDKNYYKKKDYYVIIDDLGQLPTGAEWNPNIENWEDTLHIGTREEKYEMQELPGFARSFNTIHGLILEIKKLLDTGHVYTRDENTVQGAINKLKDIIAKFEDLQPGKLILTDNYGRVHPTDTINNDWIEWDIKPDPVNPSIEVKHKAAFNAVTTVSQENTNPKFGETITTPEIAIDANGHVSSVKNENILLPKPSLTINGSGVLTSTSLVEETGALTANYTALTDVKLDGYEKTTATGDILATDSLEIGLSKLENTIAFTNDALEDVDAQLREDFAAEDAAIRSEFAAVDTAIRTDFTTADTTLQNNIDNVNTSLGNRITAIENKNDFGVGALTTRVEANENKLNGVDNVKNSLDALDSRIAAFEQGDSSTLGGLATQVENINNILNQKVACSVRGFEGDTAYALQTTTGVVQLENFIINTNNVFKTRDEDGVYGGVICPYDGVVLISCSLYYNTNSPSRRGVYIKKNADEIASYYGSTYDFPGSVHSGIIIVPVLAGDIIRVAGRTDTDEMLELLLDNSGTHLDIVYL